MDEATFSMYVLKCLERGILPLRNIDGSFTQVDKGLLDLGPEEARKMKRKFRKLWRKRGNKKLLNRHQRSFKVHVEIYREAYKEFRTR